MTILMIKEIIMIHLLDLRSEDQIEGSDLQIVGVRSPDPKGPTSQLGHSAIIQTYVARSTTVRAV